MQRNIPRITSVVPNLAPSHNTLLVQPGTAVWELLSFIHQESYLPVDFSGTSLPDLGLILSTVRKLLDLPTDQDPASHL